MSADRDREHLRHATTLLGILQDFAPNATCQALCTKMFHDAQVNGASNRDLLKTMANALCDGLTSGNWPWIVKPPSVQDYAKDKSRESNFQGGSEAGCYS